eukprot:9931738-Ditylum_brightwellii.AAC.1
MKTARERDDIVSSGNDIRTISCIGNANNAWNVSLHACNVVVSEQSHGTAIKVGSDLWIFKLPECDVYNLNSEDLGDLSRFMILPPGFDITSVSRKKKNGMIQHHKIK